MKNKKGFTLIELLIVVAIIGILAAVAIPKLLTAINKARVSTVKSDLSAIRAAIQMYAAENILPKGDINDLESVLVPSFIGSLPTNPWHENVSYTYSINANSGDYTISMPLFDDNDGFRTLYYYSKTSKFSEHK